MIVGLCGQAGVGKDTVADFMVRNHGFVKVAFADVLKRICKEVFDFSDDALWGPSEKRNEPDKRYPRGTIIIHQRQSVEDPEEPDLVCPQFLSPRHALQQLGSEWGRACYLNVWVDYTLRTARALLGQNGPNLMYDARRGLQRLGDHRDWEETDRRDALAAKGVVISDVRFRNEVDAIQAAGGKVVRITRPQMPQREDAHVSEQELLSIPIEVFDHHFRNGIEGLEFLDVGVQGLVDTLQRSA